MRLFKPMYKSKQGKYKEVKKYWVEVIDRREKGFRKVLQFPASESKRLSETLGKNIQERIDCIASGEPSPKLVDYFRDRTPKKLQDKLFSVGLLPARIKEADKPLLDYLPEFQQAIYQESKKSRLKKSTTTDKQAKSTTSRVRKIIKDCDFVIWQDVSGEKVDKYIEGRPDGMSQQTAHFYVQAF